MKRLLLLTIFLMSGIWSYGSLRADINGDCKVDMDDLIILLQEWMQEDEDCLMGLGPELVENGTFDSADGWTLDENWTISEGKAQFVQGASTEENDMTYALSVTAGVLYQVSFEITDVNGSNVAVAPYVGGEFDTFFTIGSHTITLTAIETGVFKFNGSGDPGESIEIDNVSVREVLGGLSADAIQYIHEEN